MGKILIFDNDTISNTELESLILNYNETEKKEVEYEILTSLEKLYSDKEELAKTFSGVKMVVVSYRLGKDDLKNNLKIINENFPEIKLTLTGSSDLTDDVLYDFTSNGVKCFITKPYDTESILKLIKGME